MSTNSDFEKIVRTWLQDGPSQIADRSLQAALDEVHVTSQQRFGVARRSFPMNSNAWRISAAAVIGLIVIVGGLAFLGRTPGGVGGTPPTTASSPTPIPTSASTPTPIPTTAPTPPALTTVRRALEPGTYVTGDPFRLRVTFTVPAGWEGHMGGPYLVDLGRVGGVPGGVFFAIFERVPADPCHADQGFLDPPPGPTVDDLAMALASLPGLDVTTPTDITVDGYRGKQLTLTAPDTFDGCTLSREGYVIWQLPLGATFTMTPGERDQVWILDVDGERLVVDVPELPSSTAQQRAEVQAILDSLQIEPVGPTSSPSPSPTP